MLGAKLIDQTAIGVAIITLIGVVITQYVTYQVQKADVRLSVVQHQQWVQLQLLR